MIYKADLVERYGISFAEAGQVLKAIDQNAVLEQCRQAYNYEIWDEVTPVNGVQPELITGRADYPKHREHASYFLYKDGSPVYFQYTNPVGPDNHMTAEQIPEIVEKQIEALAGSHAQNIIWELIKTEMEKL